MEQGLSGKCAEVLEWHACEVEGTVPAWLDARLLRNGPGQFDVQLSDGRGTFTVPHWFDGLTQLHEWEVQGGAVRYRSRHLYPAIEQHISRTGFVSTFYGVPRRGGLLGALLGRLLQAVGLAPGPWAADPAQAANIGVTIGHVADTLYSKTDANALAEIDPATLKPLRQTTYTAINPAFKGPFSAAHGQRDEARATYFNFTLDFQPGGIYHLFAIPDAQPAGHLLASIPADAAYVHSFAQTANYLVLMVCPLLYSLPRLAIYGSPGQAMSWQPGKGTLFYVVDKRAPQEGGRGHVATYRSDAFFCFHTINAWEEQGEGEKEGAAGPSLVIDLCAYDDASWLQTFTLPHLRSGEARMPEVDVRRCTLPDLPGAMVAGRSAVQAATLARIAGSSTPGGAWMCELPRINKAAAMRPNQYVYAAAAATRDSQFFDSIAKVDVRTGATQLWSRPGHCPGEPIFVAREGGRHEDDGLLLSVVLAGPEGHSYLLMLDAGSMREVARASVPHVVGFGFHGNVFGRDGASTDLA